MVNKYDIVGLGGGTMEEGAGAQARWRGRDGLAQWGNNLERLLLLMMMGWDGIYCYYQIEVCIVIAKLKLTLKSSEIEELR